MSNMITQSLSAIDFDVLPKSTLTGKPVLHFVHANGFTSMTYELLFDLWGEFFSIEMIPVVGLDARYVIDNHWQGLSMQVLDNIKYVCTKHGIAQLVTVGHSLGAVSSLLAMNHDPTHISQLIMLDPSIIMGRYSFSVQLAKLADKAMAKFGKNHYFTDMSTPAGLSKRRRDVFDSVNQARTGLGKKGLFKAFDSRCFELYLQYGLTAINDKYHLTIPKSIEVAIFRAIPSLFWASSPTIYRPTTLIAGADSYFTKIGSYTAVTQRWGIPIITTSGTHMFPLEHPEATATLVLNTIAKQIHPS